MRKALRLRDADKKGKEDIQKRKERKHEAAVKKRQKVVRACMCVCMNVCTYIQSSMEASVKNGQAFVCACMYVCVFICMYVCVSSSHTTFRYVCMLVYAPMSYLCLYKYTCVHTRMHTYIHKYIHTWQMDKAREDLNSKGVAPSQKVVEQRAKRLG